jgi:hypothetical protein
MRPAVNNYANVIEMKMLEQQRIAKNKAAKSGFQSASNLKDH